MEFLWGRNIFLKLFNKPMQRERNFGGKKYFFENFIAPPDNQLVHPLHTPQCAMIVKIRDSTGLSLGVCITEGRFLKIFISTKC